MNYMTVHIKEAISLNKERLPLYAALTNGESARYSKKLIRQEQLALVMAMYIDARALKFQKHGINILEKEFVSMSKVPAFSPVYPPGIDHTKPLRKTEIHSFKDALKKLNASFDFVALCKLCREMIHEMADQPHVYCMYRHLLESVCRIAHFAGGTVESALNAGMRSPAKLYRLLIGLHILMLQQAIEFDEQVAFIQVSGVPFLYQDLPSIPDEEWIT
jgi:hypothetical protein